MTFPQVAIIWWDESKTNHPKAFEACTFRNPEKPASLITNGQLVIVLNGDDLRDGTYLIDLLRDSHDVGFVAYSENLIFLGEL